MGLPPGTQFGRYELVSRLGRGGMAETYRARLMGEAGVTKPALIKKVLPEYANDESFTSMFVSEARISASLSHGNIAQVYDFGRVGEEYFLAMEFVDGQPLHRIHKRAQRLGLSSLPVPVAVFIALEMCRGLHYAHTRTDSSGQPLGIVHRDISPDNVLISYEGQVKIVDFGIAKARELRGFNTEPGVVKGKYLYFSPEQARGEDVDARTDVWATGVVLYWMLCGQLPVEGAQYTVMTRIIRGEFPRLRQLNPALPPELEAVVMRALEVDRERRLESCHELGDALAGFLYATEPRFSAMSIAHFIQQLFKEDLAAEGRTVQVPRSFLEQLERWQDSALTTAPIAPLGPPVSSSSTVPLQPVSLAPARPSGPERKWLYLGAGAGGVVALALGLGVLFTERSEEPREPTALPPAVAAAKSVPEAVPPAASSAPQAPPKPEAVAVSVAQKEQEEAARYLEDKQSSQAQSAARACLQKDEKNADCHKLAGDAAFELKEWNEAVEHYRAFLRLAPQHPQAAEVGLILRKLLSQPPSGPPSAAQKAEAASAAESAKLLIRARQYSDAVTMAKKCLSKDPDHAECEMLLGAGYAGLVQPEEAAKHYRRFVQLAPDHKLAPKVRQTLEAYDRQKK